MRTIVVGTERSLGDVVERAFPSRVSAAAGKRVAQAVRDANPRVDFDRLRRGTVLSIPDVPDAPDAFPRRGRLGLDDVTSAGLETVQAVVRSGVEELVALAGREEAAASKERTRLARALDADEVREAMDSDERLAGEIVAVRRAIEDDEAAAEGRAAVIERLGGRWAEQVDVLKLMLP